MSGAGEQPIRALLEKPGLILTPSEAKVVQVLLADYPMSGLSTQSTIAKKAAVSDPTVVRFVIKLGFESFAAFQAQLLEEVEARLRSPLMMVEAKRASGNADSLPKSFLSSVSNVMSDVAEAALPQPYEHAVRLIMEARRVTVAGGRFSRHVAGMLGGYIVQFRSSVNVLGTLSIEQFDNLVDMGKRDVLIVFDYRRYQTDIIDFARQASERGTRIVLFTDPWLSPIAEWAEVLITGKVEVDSPFDTLVTSVAQMEALVAMIVAAETDTMHTRASALEAVRRVNSATLDNQLPAARPARVKAKGRKGQPPLT